ncbi:putative protein FRMPD2-like [Pollicipes pollicipes]|uniref:putative protein FRMPD2-like n=1 Tax=Pollicipes pollicipes TaxID=41117 RepID=UPI0018851F3C|nr:putative protein FRMPD2-like [Pollicipes pollicipes]
MSINLRGSDIWLEPLQDERSSRGHREGSGQSRRRAAPREAASWDVTVTRGSRGLGLSVESAAPAWPSHVRVKRVFPHQPAALTGCIRPGDVLLRVNDMPVRGLSVQEVLHVLRLAGTEVLLSLARPAADDGDSDSDSDSDSGGRDESESASRSSLRLEPECVGVSHATSHGLSG